MALRFGCEPEAGSKVWCPCFHIERFFFAFSQIQCPGFDDVGVACWHDLNFNETLPLKQVAKRFGIVAPEVMPAASQGKCKPRPESSGVGNAEHAACQKVVEVAMAEVVSNPKGNIRHDQSE